LEQQPAHVVLIRPRLAFRIACFLGVFALIAEGRGELLTNAAQVLALSAERAAQKIPVRVKGVVTAAEPTWDGKFFVQDETSGVFVGSRSNYRPEPGDVVEVSGISYPGKYAPTISSPTCTKLGTAPLPEALAVPFEQIMSGIDDGQRVEVVGVVRSVTPGKLNSDIELASGGYRLHVFPKTPTDIDPLSLIGARVRVKGTAAASFNAALRHMLSVALFVPLRSDFIVEETERLNPFEESLVPLTGIAQYRRDVTPGKRVHVKGVVTLQRPGEDFFLEDETGGLQVRTRQTGALTAGEVVDVVGFPDFDHFLPVLDDAIFRKTDEARAPIKPARVTVADIQNGLHHADLITLRAKVLDRNFRHGSATVNGKRKVRTVLLMQQDDRVFTASAETQDKRSTLASVPIGSTIDVTGVCFTESGEDMKLRALEVLLPGPASFQLIKKPSWLTTRRLLIGLGVVLVVAVVAVIWTIMVSRRNAVLSVLIREKEAAQTELQQAHDLLEERVKERTEQLKFQITARKESEVQFKAVLSERTRLAQELHDTLEQTLTGVALQLDTASKLFCTKPDTANHHLELARDFVAQGQVDVHRSVWDLRSRVLEEFDLPGALAASGKQLTNGSELSFEVMARGRVRPLPDTLEENLLRIAQEAMTNVIKHSQATRAQIELDYGPQNILLRIRDNGCGFEKEEPAAGNNGHFGLLGISERAKRLGAELKIQSAPGQGTLLEVRVALDRAADANGTTVSPTVS